MQLGSNNCVAFMPAISDITKQIVHCSKYPHLYLYETDRYLRE